MEKDWLMSEEKEVIEIECYQVEEKLIVMDKADFSFQSAIAQFKKALSYPSFAPEILKIRNVQRDAKDALELFQSTNFSISRLKDLTNVQTEFKLKILKLKELAEM